jgi:hypothetical protein
MEVKSQDHISVELPSFAACGNDPSHVLRLRITHHIRAGMRIFGVHIFCQGTSESQASQELARFDEAWKYGKRWIRGLSSVYGFHRINLACVVQQSDKRGCLALWMHEY